MVEFREESRRSASPEQLGSYIKVSRPSVWLLLCAIAVLLAAGAAWFFAGTIHETARGTAVAAPDGSVVAYLPLEESAAVAAGNPATLEAGGTTAEAVVLEVCSKPVSHSRAQEDLPHKAAASSCNSCSHAQSTTKSVPAIRFDSQSHSNARSVFSSS